MIRAVQHVRRMRGGAQSQLMRCDDGHFYVVKFLNNPQHTRVLANELLATRLAAHVGLPVPATEIVEVGAWLIAHTPELHIQLAGERKRCAEGLQFGARFVVDPLQGHVLDYMPEQMLDSVRNVKEFCGMLALDKWTCNANGRQAVYWKKARERKYTAAFVDQGYCFNAGEWNFPDSPLRGVYAFNAVYRDVRGWQDFEPALTKIEAIAPGVLERIAGEVPPEWYGGEMSALERLVEQLYHRRTRVRELIEEFRKSSRDPFPAWQRRS